MALFTKALEHDFPIHLRSTFGITRVKETKRFAASSYVHRYIQYESLCFFLVIGNSRRLFLIPRNLIFKKLLILRVYHRKGQCAVELLTSNFSAANVSVRN